VNWIPIADEKRSRYEATHGELDERAIVRRGNTAYAAGLALLMAGDPDAAEWLRRAAARWRESWDAGEGRESWGRPVGALKAALLAGDEPAVDELARWALELGCPTAESPIGRYGGALALLALGRWAEARHVAETIRERDDFPHDVGDAVAYIAAHDVIGYIEAVESVVDSFETRDGFLEEMRVADTALVLHELARRRGIESALPDSQLLP
jgi:ribosomal protein S18 acetylase RimI-like enzyme